MESSFENNKRGSMSEDFLNHQSNWEHLFFYQKAEVLYQMTVVFCRRFLPKYGDRTVDQMIQAARSCKQNIVEGSADGVTSSESEIRLLNTARGSVIELREDYQDYLKAHSLPIWDESQPRYNDMLRFCREHNRLADYEPFFERFSAEEMANCAKTLCHIEDKMITNYIERKKKEFLAKGGIRERMTAARLGKREEQNQMIARLKAEVEGLRRENQSLMAEIKRLKG